MNAGLDGIFSLGYKYVGGVNLEVFRVNFLGVFCFVFVFRYLIVILSFSWICGSSSGLL